MDTAKIFKNGRSQAVRLPKEYRFDVEEVGINKIGDVVVLFPTDSGWAPLLDASGKFTDDFMAERKQPTSPEKRNSM